ncbi:NAD(P)H-dependent flavin oxidoreductase [Chitinasiproducens palmae]|uniref:Nitronate monooxygenase n=1 Tax=Chitinasiproducens palmae TaxID=1770053 RepID=A0A1H2PQE6_9BURK|nr:nitronate monooxygenase family protein [Chitinasiproducens palmae]SDV49026.1 nitronate monooxygenase [Chitinasiproducens palmae]
MDNGRFRKLTVPVLSAPMFLVSKPDLVVAQCQAGVIGSFPALNARPQEQLDAWLTEIETRLAGCPQPFAVNLIVHPSNARLDADLEVIVAHRVPIVITSLHAPDRVVARVHEYGGLVFHDVTTVHHARKAAAAGVDGLILVCAGAGGHGGTLNPFAFRAEVRRFFDGLLVLAGAITDGAAVFAARALGCELAYVGTRFIATEEAGATDAHKQMVVAATSRDIVYTPFFSGVPANYLKESIRAAGLDPDALPAAGAKVDYSKGETRPKAWSEVWGAGQGVGNIDAVLSVRTVVDRLLEEYRAAAQRVSSPD